MFLFSEKYHRSLDISKNIIKITFFFIFINKSRKNFSNKINNQNFPKINILHRKISLNRRLFLVLFIKIY